jgi:hypothetical protein
MPSWRAQWQLYLLPFNLIIVQRVLFLCSPYFYITPSRLSVWIPWPENRTVVWYRSELWRIYVYHHDAKLKQSIKYLTRLLHYRPPNDSSLVGREGKAVSVHAMKTYGGAEVKLHSFLTSALDGGKWWSSRPTVLSIENGPGTHRVGGLVRPRDGQGVLGKIKSFVPAGNRNPDRPAHSLA